ncbi:helix-turn-helix transcriptional regulator [Faecalimonas umbilicata]|nr:helix-turn-helix transcriptional regulator [Faecalimonas umbilicata]
MTNKILFNLGIEIQNKREEKGYTRNQLCDQLMYYGINLGENAIKSYELGRRNMKASTLIALAYVLDLDLKNIADNYVNKEM